MGRGPTVPPSRSTSTSSPAATGAGKVSAGDLLVGEKFGTPKCWGAVHAKSAIRQFSKGLALVTQKVSWEDFRQHSESRNFPHDIPPPPTPCG